MRSTLNSADELQEDLHIMENVLHPEKSFASYTLYVDGKHLSIGLDIEPRSTLLERGREEWTSHYGH